MATHTDPNQVRLTGENQYMRLHTEENGPMTTRASHWRILLSPIGPGHALFLRSDVTEDESRIYTDNIALARWLQQEILSTGEFSDQTLPVIDAVFSRSGDTRAFWTEIVETPDEGALSPSVLFLLKTYGLGGGGGLGTPRLPASPSGPGSRASS